MPPPASSRGRTLGGGSLPGFTFGVIGGLICLFEFLLWPRKALRSVRIVRVQSWMIAHIWLGLLSLPILVLHSGFHLGGSLSRAVMVVFLVVIASGVWGLTLQNLLPRKMLSDVPAETIYSQIDRIIGQFHDEAARLVDATCGRSEADESASSADDEAGDGSTRYLVIGAIRSAGQVRGKVLETRASGPVVAGSEPLRSFFRDVAGPFLRPEVDRRSPLDPQGPRHRPVRRPQDPPASRRPPGRRRPGGPVRPEAATGRSGADAPLAPQLAARASAALGGADGADGRARRVRAEVPLIRPSPVGWALPTIPDGRWWAVPTLRRVKSL